ncbi:MULTISPECIES: efflux RND transporter periplasmic adaptor subunit [Bacillus]|uniref:efflux RND transporter periplasmic adaptor subunit n=1 Tax=Bacillus TaxID=1386 RepID=UPI0002EFCD08|nr:MULTISPECIES: hypothetical protein [Bacillus]
MKKWKIYTIVAIVIAFVGCNLFLLIKEDSKANKTAYIADWTSVKNDDVKKTFKTEGVVKPEEEHSFFYDENQGPFASFQVKEGDMVSVGTALFTYGSKALEEEKADIEAEITQIKSEIESIEDQISDLEKINSTSSNNSTTSSDKDTKVQVDVHVTNVIEGDIEKAIAEAQSEIGKLEAKLVKREADLSRNTDKLSEVTVNSDVAGQVISINRDIQNPVITIASKTVAVEGVLSEKQMKEAAINQKVSMYSSLHDKKYNGSIQQIVSYPKDKISVKKTANYPFTVQLDESDEKLLPGAKLRLTVVVDEVKDVPVISKTATFKNKKKQYVYQLTQKGTVEKKLIETGLTFNGKQEVAKGLEAGNFIATNPSKVDTVNAKFITPMTTLHIDKNEWKELSKKKMAKYFLIGLLEK